MSPIPTEFRRFFTIISLGLALLTVAGGSLATAQEITRKALFFDGVGVPATVAIQSDGRVVAIGRIVRAGATDTDVAVMRFNPDGSPDASFGTNGRVTTDFLGTDDNATLVAIQSDGKILVAGTTQVFRVTPPHSFLVVALARYTAAGALDPTFGSGGKVVQAVDPSSTTNYRAVSVAVAPSLDIVLAVLSSSAANINGLHELQRYTSDGARLPDWSAAPEILPYSKGLAFGPGGNLFTLGYAAGAASRVRVARYTLDGAPDPAFGSGGTADAGPGSAFGAGIALAVQPDGKPVVTLPGSVGRRTAAGALDTAFGRTGEVAAAFNAVHPGGFLRSVAIAPNGSIVTAGSTQHGVTGTYGDFGVLVTDSSGAVVARFTTEFGGEDYADAVLPLPDGAVVAAGISITGRFTINPVYSIAWTQFVPRRWQPLAPSAVTTDFDGDSRSDLVAISPGGEWQANTSASGLNARQTYQWGAYSDIPVAADFDADGRTDVAVYRPSTGVWYAINPQTLRQSSYQWGAAGDVPVPGDYDGDGRTELAVWRPATGEWHSYNLASRAVGRTQWGSAGDRPIPRDYDRDGITDLGVYRPSTGEWWILNLVTGRMTTYKWGAPDDLPVPADYTGDLRTDIAVYRPSTGTWWILNPITGTYSSAQWGAPGDQPVPGDYIGDRRSDLAVWRPETGEWFIWDLATGRSLVVPSAASSSPSAIAVR